MTEQDIDEMKALVALARKRPLQFAICLGKKPETTVFIMHRMKDGEILARQAKKEGDTAKVAYGEANVEGKNLMLSCAGEIPAGISKRMRTFLTGQKLPMKVVVLNAAGEIVDDDGDSDLEKDQTAVSGVSQPAGLDGASATEVDPLAANWAKVKPAISKLVDRAVTAGADRAPQIQSAWNSAVQAAEVGKFKDALVVASKLKPILASLAASHATEQENADADAPAASDDAKRWVGLEPAMVALYERAMGHKPENASQLSAAWAMATEKAGAGDHATALKIAARLKRALDAVIARGGNGAAREIPQDVVAFQKSRVLWVNTRTKMMQEMRKLEDAIIAACDGQEDLQPFADEARGLTKRLETFDEKLQDVLDQITNSDAGDGREALKGEARSTIDAYRAALGGDFFKAVDTDNGFTNVAVAASARQSLDVIAKAIS